MHELERLRAIFAGSEVTRPSDKAEKYEIRPEKYEIRLGGSPFSAAEVFRVCDVLGCTPEELFWNPDLDYTGCYYPDDQPKGMLVFEVRRK